MNIPKKGSQAGSLVAELKSLDVLRLQEHDVHAITLPLVPVLLHVSQAPASVRIPIK